MFIGNDARIEARSLKQEDRYETRAFNLDNRASIPASTTTNEFKKREHGFTVAMLVSKLEAREKEARLSSSHNRP